MSLKTNTTPGRRHWVRAALAGICLALISRASATPSPAPPAINTNNLITITSAPYNAVGDGTTTNTAAIQSAINAASAVGATNGLSGGTVRIPAGTFLSGPLVLGNNVNLQLDSGALLRMLPYGQYPGGIVNPSNFISGSSLHDVEISGAGAMDGQGLPWWQISGTNSSANRPVMVNLSACTRVLIQDATFSNSPSPHLVIKGKAGNVMIQRVTISAPSSSDPVNPSHNTDAIDLAETNTIIQNCHISVGDDNVAIGSSASSSADILVTNCAFGDGHGVSIGSFTSGGVSNVTVVDCTFTNTDQGIRIKSDRDRGGVVQNINYFNLTMSNVQYPILIYCSYTNTDPTFKSINNITPPIAASYPSNAVTGTTPIYRNITLSNITATAQSGRMAGLIWGLPEMAVSNFTLAKVTLTGSKTFGIYYARGLTLVDSQIITPAGVTNISFFNAQLTFTNATPPARSVSLDGTATNGIGSTLLFYNAPAGLQNTNALANSPGLTLGGSTLTVSNNLNLAPAAVLNFVAGTNASTLAVVSNLTAAGTINVSAGAGFTNAAYTLLTYGNTLSWGPPALGSVPAGFNYALDTNLAHQVRLLVTSLAPPTPAGLVATATNLAVRLAWTAVPSATNYNVKRSTTNGGTYPLLASTVTANYTDSNVTNGVTYYYVVSAVGTGGESSNSVPASAAPLPSSVPVNLAAQFNAGQMQLSWPRDHLGWHLLIQTNSAPAGLGTNWTIVSGSQQTNALSLPINPANASVFLRLVYP